MLNMKRKLPPSSGVPEPLLAVGKRRKSGRVTGGSSESSSGVNDSYCWICHKEGEVICCETCPRVFHLDCIQLSSSPTEDWVCPECVLIMTAENLETRSRAMRLLSVDQLCTLLKHALSRLKSISGVDPFVRAVDPIQFPAYRDYVFHPMDLLTLEKNIRKKQYGSTEAFLADIKWILHNCIIFNSLGSKLSNIAKQLVKICKHEMQEIENCPDCYTNAHTKKESWFIAACRIPHLLVWAKLKGFPFWPAKAMRVNAEDHVDVRFFGAHDRAWVPMRDVFIYSQEPPVPIKNKKKGNLEGCIKEVELYIKNITDKCGEFRFAPSKTPFDAKKEEEQIKLLYPKCTLPFDIGPIRTRARSLSFSGSERSRSRTPTPAKDESHTTTTKIDLTGGGEEETSTDIKKATADDSLEDTSVSLAKEGEEKEIVAKEVVEGGGITGKGNEDKSKDQEQPSLDEEMDDEEEEEVDDVEPENDESEKKGPAVAAPPVATEPSSSDRVAASPPCEVSSTTTSTSDNTTSNVGASKGPEKKTGAEGSSKPEPKLAVIAETSETVIIEGDEDEDEEEIDDDEEAVMEEAATEIDDVEPESESVEAPTGENNNMEGENTKEDKQPKEIEEEKETSTHEKNASNDSQTAIIPADKQPLEEDPVPPPTPEEEENAQKSPSRVPPREEEIDDVEPESALPQQEEEEPMDTTPPQEEKEAQVTKEMDATDEGSSPSEGGEEVTSKEVEQQEVPLPNSDSLDTSRLLASGVSVTIKPKPLPKASSESSTTQIIEGSSIKEKEGEGEKKKPPSSMAELEDSDLNSELSLGSDISVTVVQKKKSEASLMPPRISVKKESELLAGSNEKSSTRDIVHVSRTSARKALNPLRKSLEDSEDAVSGGSPPDPIVTISKVQALVSSGGVMPSSSRNESKQSNAPTQQQLQSSSSSNRKTIANPSLLLPPPTSSSMNQHSTRSSSSSAASNGPLVNMLGSAPRMIPPHPQQQHHHRGRAMSQSSMMRSPPVGGMPSLHPRPQGLFAVPPPLPSAAGPVSEQLNRVAGKLVDYMRLSLEELFREMASSGSPEATIKALQIEIEKMQWRHQQELAENRHNAELKFQELQHAMEAEKQKIISDIKKQCDMEKQKAVAEAKKKQWCSHCGKEAIFYCCWNTSYCDYPCQQAHWPTHMSTCAQNQANNDEEGLNAGGNASSGSNNNHPSTSEMSHPHAPEPLDHPTTGHFLSNAGGSSRNQSNGMMPAHARGMQPMMMPFGHSGINPRLMSQLGMRFCGPHPGGGGPRGGPGLPSHLRFPGNYFL